MKLHSDLRELLESFLSRGVEFVVVGGHAVAFHGRPRVTQDTDLFVRPTIDNGRRIVDALAAFGFGGIQLTAEDFTVPDRMIQLGRVPNRIDLLTGIFGVTFDEAWSTRVEGDLGGVKVPMIGREALIRNKRATGRPMDLADADWIESSKR